jgi:hypothetical protein
VASHIPHTHNTGRLILSHVYYITIGVAKRSSDNDLRKTLLSKRFSLNQISAYDVVSQLRFSKQDIRRSNLSPIWRQVNVLGDFARKVERHIATKVEATSVLFSRLAIPVRKEDLEKMYPKQERYK